MDLLKVWEPYPVSGTDHLSALGVRLHLMPYALEISTRTVTIRALGAPLELRAIGKSFDSIMRYCTGPRCASWSLGT